jgi:Asp-tRNA(Asn)/Glu-tRNA(Gln) amidotransferase B subunit
MALDYEIARQIGFSKSGGVIHQETRLWNTAEQRTIGMRSKEQAHDYRYFPEPDLAPVRKINEREISGKMAKDIFAKMVATGKSPQEIIDSEGFAADLGHRRT